MFKTIAMSTFKNTFRHKYETHNTPNSHFQALSTGHELIRDTNTIKSNSVLTVVELVIVASSIVSK